MELTLKFIRESESAAAVLYETKDGVQIWIPRSVISHRTKFPADATGEVRHRITLEEWFTAKKPELKVYI